MIRDARVASRPYPFPLDGRLDATAVLVIDMQVDFCGAGGYMDRRGGDLAALRAPIGSIGQVLAAVRQRGMTVVYTREAFAPDLHDLQPHRRGTPASLASVGDEGRAGRFLVRGEPGWEVIPELAPEPHDLLYDKPGYGVFAFSSIERDLRERGIGNLVLTGVTTDCCVQSILREALDRGFDCLVLADCCAAGDRERHETALRLIDKPTGTFGALADSEAFLETLG